MIIFVSIELLLSERFCNFVCNKKLPNEKKGENQCMKTTEEILDLLRQFKSTAGEKYGIEQLALFGSAARGEQREDSDIDICVKPRRPIDYFTLLDIKEDLEKLLRIKVDLLTLHENMRQLFRQNIERDAIYI